jgi:hypothetical protein
MILIFKYIPNSDINAGVKFIQFVQETFKDKKLKEDVVLFYAQELVLAFECLEKSGFICR